MINLRSLLYRVMGKRGDILERQALVALQLACRQLCKETLRLRASWTEPMDDSKWSKGFGGETYHALVPVAPSLEGVDNETKTWAVLRVLKATLGKAGVTDPGSFLYLRETDLPTLRKVAHDRMPVPGAIPDCWADADGALVVYPGFAASLGWDTLYVEAALMPTSQDFEQILLPLEFEDALVAGALKEIFERAGAGQNFDLAKSYAAAWQNDIARLRGQNLIGTSGAPGRKPGPFDFRVRTW